MLTGTNLKYTKAHNVRIVLETIRLFGPMTRVEIARRTELTVQTVSNITKRLMKAGLILEAARLQEGRGAPSTLMDLNPDGAFSIGLDFDKDHLTGVLVDFTGNVRQRISLDLDFPAPPEALDLMETTARQLIQMEGVRREWIWGIGVGFPGPLGVSEGSFVTNIVNPQAFPGWANVPVVDLLGERLSLPIYLENNATAAAVGERWYGGGQHISTFFYLFFGSGLGGGLIVNGQPLEGNSGNAGELGYIPTTAGLAEEMNGGQPHLGVFFNLPRLYRMLQASGVSVTRPAELEELFEQQNEILLQWLETGAMHLAPLILAIEFLIDPEAIIFGGRLPNVITCSLLDRLELVLPKLRIVAKSSYPKLRCATVGPDAAALGVATLPLFASLSPAPRLLMKQGEGGLNAQLMPAHRKTLNS